VATIDDIIAKLQALPIANDGSLTLTPDAFGIDFINAFFTQVVGASSLQFQNAIDPFPLIRWWETERDIRTPRDKLHEGTACPDSPT